MQVLLPRAAYYRGLGRPNTGLSAGRRVRLRTCRQVDAPAATTRFGCGTSLCNPPVSNLGAGMSQHRLACVVGAVLALGGVTAGCTPDVPAPPPPTLTASPPETDLERQEREAFESAEHSYRAFRAEYGRVIRSGGSRRATPTMRRYATGEYLQAMVAFTSRYKEEEIRSKGQERIAFVRADKYQKTRLELTVCEDATQVRNYNRRGKFIGSGIAARADLQMRLMQGTWKIATADYTQVEQCVGA